MNETQTKDRHLRWPVILGLVLALLLAWFFIGDLNIYGVICVAHHFDATPNEALIRFKQADAERYGVTAESPVYLWTVDESNAIACFPGPEGILAERFYTKDGGYFATGQYGFFGYDQPDMPEGKLVFSSEIRRILPNGRYGEGFRYAFFRGSGEPPEGHIVLRFSAHGEDYALVAP